MKLRQHLQTKTLRYYGKYKLSFIFLFPLWSKTINFSCALDELVLAAEATDPAIMCDHLQAAMEAYAEMVGGRVTEQILDNIFSKLCIGK